MKNSIIFLISFFSSLILFGDKAISSENPTNNSVQLAILLDTSNSMDGLIEQAKTQLWKIVNEMARSKRDGKNIKIGRAHV
jgi:hypothetical protein